MEKYVETITLTRKSYDELVKKSNEKTELAAKEAVMRTQIEVVVFDLKNYIFDNFMKNHRYSMNGIATAEDYLSYYFRDRGIRDYDELLKILGYEFIERKVVELYDNAGKEPKD